MYPEHRFASLVWGLESLHRRMAAPIDDTPLRAKIKRIVDQIQNPKIGTGRSDSFKGLSSLAWELGYLIYLLPSQLV